MIIRRESKHEKYWKSVSKNYKRVMPPDVGLLMKLIDTARGTMSLERFGYTCGLSDRCLPNVLNGTRKNLLSVKDIVLISIHTPEKSGVTASLLYAAMGMCNINDGFTDQEACEDILKKRKQITEMPEPERVSGRSKFYGVKRPRKKPAPAPVLDDKKVKYVLDAVLDGEQEKARRSLRRPTDGTQNYAQSYDADNRDGFIDDLSFYARGQGEDVLEFLKRRQDALFQNKEFAKTLYLYHESTLAERAQRVKDLQAYYETGDAVPERRSWAKEYRLVLDSYVKAALGRA